MQETTQDIEEILNNMDEEQKREFTQSVDVVKLTLLSVWKKLDRQHFVRIIWLCVKAYGGRFSAKEEILPSFVENEEEIEIFKKEENLKESQKELIELKKQIELCKNKISSIEDNLEREKRLLNNAIKSKDRAEDDIIGLEKVHVKLIAVKKSLEDELKEIKEKMENVVLEELDLLMEEFKIIKFKAIDINNKISDINMQATYKNKLIEDNTKTILTKKESIKNIGNEFQQLKMEAHNLINSYNEKRKELYKKEEEKRNEIFERWIKFFNKYTFDYNALGNIVNFSRKELLHIEECLYELHFIKDPMAISMGIIESKNNRKEKEEYEYIDVSFSDNFQIEIQFKVLGNEEKNIHIAAITPEF